MTKHNKFIFLFSFIFVIFLTSMVSAVPPVQSTIVAPNGLEIEATNFMYLSQNTYHVFRFRVYNATNDVFLNDDAVNCSMGIVDEKGEYVFQQPTVTATGYVFMVNVTAENFTRLGFYHQGINCITNDGVTAGGVKTLSFEVTTQGFISATDSSNYKLFIILMIVAAAIFLLAYVLNSDWLIFLAGIIWVLTGMYGMIYGIGNLANLYTRGLSVVIMVIGMVFCASSIYNVTGDDD